MAHERFDVDAADCANLFSSAGVSAEEFLQDYWLRKPCFVARNASHYFEQCLLPQALDEMLACRNARYPEVALAIEGKHIPFARYCTTETVNGVTIHCIDPHAVRGWYAKGANILFRSIHTGLPSVAALSARLEARFRRRFSAICFASPAGSASFPQHSDPTGSLVFQVSGRKHWLIAADPGQTQVSRPVNMTAGSILYLPPNWPHYVSTVAEASISLNYAIETPTWQELLRLAVDEMLEQPHFSAQVLAAPDGTMTEDVGAVLDLLQRQVQALDVDALSALLMRRIAPTVSGAPGSATMFDASE